MPAHPQVMWGERGVESPAMVRREDVRDRDILIRTATQPSRRIHSESSRSGIQRKAREREREREHVASCRKIIDTLSASVKLKTSLFFSHSGTPVSPKLSI
jgi:hypothetical protein